MVKMKGGAEGWIIGIIIIFVLLLIGGGSYGLYLLFKCTKVTDTCANDDDCCEYLKCVGTKCCSPSTKVCSKNNECCGTLECKDNKCTEPNGGTEPTGGNGGTEPTGGNGGNNCPQDWFNKEVFDKCTCSKKSDKKEKHASEELWRCISPPCKERCNNIQNDFCKSESIIEFNKEPLFESKALECCSGSTLYKPSCSNGAFKGRRWGGGAGYVDEAEGNFITRCGTHEHWYCK